MNDFSKFRLALLGIAGVAFAAAVSAAPNSTATPTPPPPLPAFAALEVQPASLTFHHGRDGRRVIVLGKTDDGRRYDLTATATFEPAAAVVDLDGDGYFRPKTAGATTVRVRAGGKEIAFPVTVENASLAPVRFVRDVEPILAKSGCNQGTCHGSAKGKNGFKLSLRGYDPDYDYQTLINDLSGRRFNRVAVEESLMLQKPTAEVPHEGRQAIKPGSREYEILRSWIAEGTPFEDVAVARAKRIEILPPEIEMDLPGRVQQVLVIAHYADGSDRDVTREAVITGSNPEIVEAKNAGAIRGLRRGEAAVLVRYEGQYATRLVTIMGDRTGYAWKEVPEHNFIDQHVNAKLRQMKILPSEVCTEAEFIRRASLDLTGLPPKPDVVRAFLKDPAPTQDKRNQLIEQLLTSREYEDYWASRWADLLQCNSDNLGQKGVWVFRDWIRRQIAENTPYDQFVRSLLLAQGSVFENPAANYLRALRETDKMTEDVSQTFLGVRFNCNKCHDHPFERWTQNQYYEFGAFFAQVAFKRGTLGRDRFRNNNSDFSEKVAEEIVYRNYLGGEVKHPKTDKVMAPHVPYGQAREIKPDEDRRAAFVEWMTAKDNPFFAKSAVNRLWSYLMGKGIIDPVDDIRAGNPPSNPALLDALTADFVAHGFDVRNLLRTICRSRTYQLSINRNHWNEDDTINFSHATPRRLSAEQILDALTVATGYKVQYSGLPAGMRSVQLPDGMVAGNDFLALFGRPKRQSACECERSSNLTLSHALNMINGNTISEAVNSPAGRIAQLADTEKDNQKLVENVYLLCLCRPPSKEEVAAIDFSKGASRLEVAEDLAWALLNSPAFLFNR